MPKSHRPALNYWSSASANRSSSRCEYIIDFHDKTYSNARFSCHCDWLLPSICKFLIPSWLNPSWWSSSLSSAIWKSSSSPSEKLSVGSNSVQHEIHRYVFMLNNLLVLTTENSPSGSGWRLWQCLTALKISSIRLSSCGQNHISVIGGSSSTHPSIGTQPQCA